MEGIPAAAAVRVVGGRSPPDPRVSLGCQPLPLALPPCWASPEGNDSASLGTSKDPVTRVKANTERLIPRTGLGTGWCQEGPWAAAHPGACQAASKVFMVPAQETGGMGQARRDPGWAQALAVGVQGPHLVAQSHVLRGAQERKKTMTQNQDEPWARPGLSEGRPPRPGIPSRTSQSRPGRSPPGAEHTGLLSLC